MDDSVRLQYLEAMGIDVWVPRHPPVAAAQVVEDPSQSENVATVGWVERSETRHDDAPPAEKNVGWAEQREAHHDSLALSESIAPPEMPNRWASFHLAQPTSFASRQPSTQATHHHADDHAWKGLQHEVAICRACSLCETRTQTVFGVGNKHASWMLIGEAPGQNEDLQGEPFVGRAGQLLNEMLRAIGLQREEVYIANILKCRPPNNRDPQTEEVAACHGFLQRQIALLQPKIILAVGRIAAQNLLKTQQPLAKLRGVRHQLSGIPLIVIHHPAYLLRSLPEKAKAWEDLKFALSVYQELERNHVETVK